MRISSVYDDRRLSPLLKSVGIACVIGAPERMEILDGIHTTGELGESIRSNP